MTESELLYTERAYKHFVHKSDNKITLAQYTKLCKITLEHGYPETISWDITPGIIILSYDIPGIRVIGIDTDGSSHT